MSIITLLLIGLGLLIVWINSKNRDELLKSTNIRYCLAEVSGLDDGFKTSDKVEYRFTINGVQYKGSSIIDDPYYKK